MGGARRSIDWYNDACSRSSSPSMHSDDGGVDLSGTGGFMEDFASKLRRRGLSQRDLWACGEGTVGCGTLVAGG
jgi:hypothetical protein